MPLKWIGAVFVFFSCGGFGFLLVHKHKQEENDLRSALKLLQTIQWELQYRLTPLPDLCRIAAREVNGTLKQTFLALSAELDNQILPDVQSCMHAAIQMQPQLSQPLKRILKLLGESLGKYHLSAQIQGLESVQMLCIKELDFLNTNRDIRLRSYQTLGLCAGAALAILLL